jgi:hypothetical protein
MSSLSLNLHPLKVDLIFGTVKLIWSQIGGTGLVFHFSNQFSGQKLLDRALCKLEHCHGEENNSWAKVQASFYAELHVTTLVFPNNKLWPCGMNSK